MPLDDKMIRLKEVMDITSLSRAEIYRRAADGRFPKQTRISYHLAAWRLSDVRLWMERTVGAG